MTAKPVKTFLCKKSVHYLGYKLNKNGITTTEHNIKKYPIRKSVKEVRGYLGLILLYRKLIARLSNYSVKLSDFNRKQTEPFVWTDEANRILAIIMAYVTFWSF